MDVKTKDLLFYSNYCNYCKSLLSLLIKKNVRDQFLLICVDKKELSIPNFVDRVPLILTSKKEIYIDDALQRYIDKKTQETIEADVMPFMFSGGINSSQYTYITSDGSSYDESVNFKGDMIQANNFVLLGTDNLIPTPVDKEAESKTNNKFDQSMLEQYLNMRKMDDDHIKRMQNTIR